MNGGEPGIRNPNEDIEREYHEYEELVRQGFLPPIDSQTHEDAFGILPSELGWLDENDSDEPGPSQPLAGVSLDHEPNSNAGSQPSEPESSPLTESVLRILDCIDKEHLTVGKFLDAMMWGERACTLNARVRRIRTGLLRSPQWEAIVYRAYRPPRPPKSKKARPEGAHAVMERFALRATLDVLDRELEEIDPLLRSEGDGYQLEDLTILHLGYLVEEIQRRAPRIWSLLHALSHRQTGRRSRRFKKKDPSNLCNRLQRLLALYFKFKGLSARGCDALHSLRVTMSSRWLNKAVKKTSNAAMTRLRRIVKAGEQTGDTFCPKEVGYDNIKLSFQIFSPTFDKQAPSGHGTAAIFYYKESLPELPKSVITELQNKRQEGMNNPLTAKDIFDLAQESYPTIEQFMVFEALNILLQSEEFDMKSYQHHTHPALQPPTPIRALPIGPEHSHQQYMLPTMPIPEQSYEDNIHVIGTIVKELGYDTVEKLRALGLENLIFWLGDQLTVQRIRGAQRMRCQDINATDRLDWALPIWQWLHAMMAYEKSLHKQYLGSETGFGFMRAFGLLGRYDLAKSGTEGHFHERFEHVLRQVIEAYLRECWLIIGNVSNLQELRQKTPTQLRALAERLVRTYGSTAALSSLRGQVLDAEESDEVREFATMFVRDLLQYLALKRAIQTGDVGFMQMMLPLLLFRFAASHNSQYVGEILETLQGFHREWPVEITDFIIEHCWLTNPHGKRDTFTPIDRMTEEGVKDMKVTHPTHGPHATWDYLRVLHPVLPVVKQLSTHVEKQFKTWVRYNAHSRPHDRKGIATLQRILRTAGVFWYQTGRQLPAGNETPDFVDEGLFKLIGAMDRWQQARYWPRRRTEENEPQSSDESDGMDDECV
ncbi:hypothetical protein K474DRAFT_1640340 [Panus rudis PR-1116 ss-1]|nr:hypothetical protein K474DRAFT_1640340 [Panus rudis PR-1116 ss-1]